MRRTLHDTMVEEGARVLLEGLYENGVLPPSYRHRKKVVLRFCHHVEREWLRGEIASPLFDILLGEVIRRLKAMEQDET
jgi:hypothetical protein